MRTRTPGDRGRSPAADPSGVGSRKRVGLATRGYQLSFHVTSWSRTGRPRTGAVCSPQRVASQSRTDLQRFAGAGVPGTSRQSRRWGSNPRFPEWKSGAFPAWLRLRQRCVRVVALGLCILDRDVPIPVRLPQRTAENGTRTRIACKHHRRIASYGTGRNRTDDPLRAKQVLSLLSYSPMNIVSAGSAPAASCLSGRRSAS